MWAAAPSRNSAEVKRSRLTEVPQKRVDFCATASPPGVQDRFPGSRSLGDPSGQLKPAVLFPLCRDILNFLREGELPHRDRVRAVHREAQYYAIGPLLDSLEDIQPLTGEKVRQAFLDLLPYYRGTGRGRPA